MSQAGVANARCVTSTTPSCALQSCCSRAAPARKKEAYTSNRISQAGVAHARCVTSTTPSCALQSCNLREPPARKKGVRVRFIWKPRWGVTYASCARFSTPSCALQSRSSRAAPKGGRVRLHLKAAMRCGLRKLCEVLHTILCTSKSLGFSSQAAATRKKEANNFQTEYHK